MSLTDANDEVNLDLAWDLAEGAMLKIERPTAQEIVDRVRDGHPSPVWVLKHRLPTHPMEYFDSTDSMFKFLSSKLSSKKVVWYEG